MKITKRIPGPSTVPKLSKEWILAFIISPLHNLYYRSQLKIVQPFSDKYISVSKFVNGSVIIVSNNCLNKIIIAAFRKQAAFLLISTTF